MENIQTLGKRSSLLIKDQVYSLVILPTAEKKKVGFLFLWLFAWSVSGMIVLVNYFTLTNPNTKLVIIMWLAFWAYFEFKIIRVYLWKRFGKEKLWIKNGTLYYQQDINGRGKVKEFDTNLVSGVKLIPLTPGSIADTFSQTFWVKGGERIAFECQGKMIRFGMQLEDDEAAKIIASLQKFLK
ncbi:MAG: hypothetical protein K0R26_2866 [Bacteroidota bacterium]|jgi:hypothetical protein|nr:hypothetical protein [Bacteroidota bacterium]